MDLERVVARTEELFLKWCQFLIITTLLICLIDLAIFANVHEEGAMEGGAEVFHIYLLFKIGGAPLVEFSKAGAACHIVRLQMVPQPVCTFDLSSLVLVLWHIYLAFYRQS